MDKVLTNLAKDTLLSESTLVTIIPHTTLTLLPYYCYVKTYSLYLMNNVMTNAGKIFFSVSEYPCQIRLKQQFGKCSTFLVLARPG